MSAILRKWFALSNLDDTKTSKYTESGLQSKPKEILEFVLHVHWYVTENVCTEMLTSQ